MTAPEKLVFIGPKRKYHAAHSGYEVLSRFLDASPREVTVPATVERSSRAVAALVGESSRRRWLRSLGLRSYGRRRLLQELSAAPTLLFARGAVVHHLYGEESYRLGGWVPRLRGSRLVATFHMPPSRFADWVSDPAPLGRLDAVIAIARGQADFLRRFARPGRVFFVPHGVDTEFFTPATESPRDFRCVFVGYFLRDFATLRKVIERLTPQGVVFDLVLTPGKARDFEGIPGVSVATGLGEEAFRETYRRASVLLLPLLDSTGNNALLESMSCGLPAVTTDVGGARDYCDASHALLVPPGDVDGFVEAVLRLRDDPALRTAMGRSARERAVREFDWHLVAAAVRRVYAQTLS